MPLSRAKLDSGEYPSNLSVGLLSEIGTLHIMLIDAEPETICRSNALIVAIVAGAFGFGGISADAAWIAKILFFGFLALFVISFVLGKRGPGA